MYGRRDIPIKKSLAPVIVSVVIGVTFASPLIAIPYYMFNCEVHLLYTILPTCPLLNKEGIVFYILLILVNCVSTFYTLGSILFLTLIGVSSILFRHEIFVELR